jgi:hypothetical protein
VTLPPWLQSAAYVGHAVWSQPFSKPSVTCAMVFGASASASVRRAVCPSMIVVVVVVVRLLGNNEQPRSIYMFNTHIEIARLQA